MPPELIQNQPYKGSKVDIFSSGIVLFLLPIAHPPFTKAINKDPLYSILIHNPQKYWEIYCKEHSITDISVEFKDLVQRMLASDPNQRPSLEEISSHPWMLGDIPSSQEIQQEFNTRAAILSAKQEYKLKALEEKKVPDHEKIIKEHEAYL